MSVIRLPQIETNGQPLFNSTSKYYSNIIAALHSENEEKTIVAKFIYFDKKLNMDINLDSIILVDTSNVATIYTRVSNFDYVVKTTGPKRNLIPYYRRFIEMNSSFGYNEESVMSCSSDQEIQYRQDCRLSENLFGYRKETNINSSEGQLIKSFLAATA